MPLKKPPVAVLVLVVGLALGCSSGGGGGAISAPPMSWVDDGAPVTPFGADATLTSSGGTDSLRIDGLRQGAGSVTIVMTAPTPFAAQTFDCNQLASGQTVLVSYANGTGFDVNDQSCTVVICQVRMAGGPAVTGTFEAVISLTPSGTKTISNGVFNLPVQM
jgi:hypothetical protein